MTISILFLTVAGFRYQGPNTKLARGAEDAVCTLSYYGHPQNKPEGHRDDGREPKPTVPLLSEKEMEITA